MKGVAVTGAGPADAHLGHCRHAAVYGSWDWDWARSIVFGLTLSCASTVVVTKALEMRRLTTDPRGQVAIGWLIVQDLVTVFIMVCLPLIAQLSFQNDTAIDPCAVVISLSKTLLGLVISWPACSSSAATCSPDPLQDRGARLARVSMPASSSSPSASPTARARCST